NTATLTNATVADGIGLGTIVDDDDLAQLSIDDVTTDPEGDSGTTNAEFTVSLDTASGKTITVEVATNAGTAAAGDDYVGHTQTLTFDPGETSKTFTVEVNGDLLDEFTENYT